MQFDELGNMNGKTLMLLPGTCCDYQTNFATVLDRLEEKYHLICVNYDGFDGSEKRQARTRKMIKDFFLMDDETADRFMECFAKFSPQSIKNEYYTDLLTHLDEDIHVEGTTAHFIYANKMGKKNIPDPF